MVQENSAHGAQRESFARVPTGFRRMTPGLLKADRAAEKFTGFPEGVTSHGQLLAAFKAAVPKLGISPRLVHAVDYLFCYTKPQDWKPDSRPIVWPSNEILSTALGLERSQVKQIIRHLIELGLVTMKDSPNGKRYGNRHPNNETGRITEAYGFDLSLFAVRYAEFKRLAKEHDAERRALKKLRRRRTIALKAITQLLETAEEYGFEPEEWQILARETADLARALKNVERPDEMEIGVTSLERRWQAARERLETLLGTVDSDPKGPENRPHIYNYNPTAYLNKDTVIAAEGCSGAGETPVPQLPAPVHRERPEKGMVNGIAPEELARLAPKLKKYLSRPDPTWRDIIDAADWLRHDLDISKSLWGDACVAMGRELAAQALAIVSTKELGQEPGQIHSSHGGYFRGVVAKHVAGELHLERTVWDLRHKIDPERYAARSRARRRNADDGREYRQ
jgi:replication initiation protein RepC